MGLPDVYGNSSYPFARFTIFRYIGFSKSHIGKKGFTYPGNTRVNALLFFRPIWPARKKTHMRRSSCHARFLLSRISKKSPKTVWLRTAAHDFLPFLRVTHKIFFPSLGMDFSLACANCAMQFFAQRDFCRMRFFAQKIIILLSFAAQAGLF